MTSFIYKAVNREGEAVEAYREAPDEQTLIRLLQDEGCIPIRVTPASAKPFAWLTVRRGGQLRISQKEITLFTRELSTLLGAGLPLDRSLAVLMQLTGEDSRLYALTERLLEAVKGGANLSDALESHGGVFSRLYLNMVRAGEVSGTLESVLERLADYLERSKELRASVSTALIYPAILVVMAVASLMVLLTFVVPQFTEMFETAGRELPLPTQVVVGIAEGLRSYWWLMGLSVFLIILYMRHQLTDEGRRYGWDRRFLKWPLVGDLICKVEMASLGRTLATLLNNGVSLLAALSIVKETLSNRVLAEQVSFAAETLKEGGEMSTPLIDSGLFPVMAMQMVKLGEETGRLPEMLGRVADTYDNEVKVTLQRMLTLLEPILIVGLGILIAGIIISILMAIISVNDLAF